LKTADVVVLSSHYEGLSLASIEGMASGKPFVASNVPGLREIVRDFGLLFEDKSSRQLADLIMTIKSDSQLYSDVSKKCIDQSGKYNIAEMVEKYIQVYRQLVF
jgi:glycosyltransferase involved in cell wall biosynthesis